MFGKLSQRNLYAGYVSLSKLEECIQHKGNIKDIEYYHNAFYKNIPHNTHINPVLTINTIRLKKEEILKMIQIRENNQDH